MDVWWGWNEEMRVQSFEETYSSTLSIEIHFSFELKKQKTATNKVTNNPFPTQKDWSCRRLYMRRALSFSASAWSNRTSVGNEIVLRLLSWVTKRVRYKEDRDPVAFRWVDSLLLFLFRRLDGKYIREHPSNKVKATNKNILLFLFEFPIFIFFL